MCARWLIATGSKKMAGSLNQAQIIGRLGKDPEIRTTQNGGKIANLSVATSESWTDKASGERKERTEWHRVVVFNERCATFAERYLKKGALVFVTGPIRTRKWTSQDGQDHYSTEVCVENFRGDLTSLDSRQDGDQGASDQPRSEGRQGGGNGGRDGQDSRSRGTNDRGGGTPDPRYRGAAYASGAAGGAGAAKQSAGSSWDVRGGGDFDDEIPF